MDIIMNYCKFIRISKHYAILSVFILIMHISTVIFAYSTGAPPYVCKSRLPLHENTHPSTTNPKFEIRSIPGRGRIRIILGSNEGFAFMGFIVNAKDIESGEIVGEFINIPHTAQGVQCTPGINNTVTHIDSKGKQNIELEWTVPRNYQGTIIFNSTFVQSYTTYWVGVESPRITIFDEIIQVNKTTESFTTVKTITTPYFMESQFTNMNAPVERHQLYEDCGTTKNCFGSTDGCIDTGSCDTAVAVEVKGETYHFELLANKGRYVAVGLSRDNKMGDDSVVECVDKISQVGIYMSWNVGKTNTRLATSETVTLETGSVKDGVLYSNGIDYHDLTYVASSESKLLSVIGRIATTNDILVRIHGGLMIASWIGTASVGILIARYYKQTWLRCQLGGSDQWFVWHRFLMILTWLMTMAASIVIFIQIGEWSTETIHASLGIMTTILTFVQPIMAALRPHPGKPRRQFFNWAHWLVGNAAHISAVIAIFFAVRLNKANIPEWTDWILMGYVVFHVITHTILSVASCATDKRDESRIDAFPMKSLHNRGSIRKSDMKKDAPLAKFRKFFFGCYSVIITAFVLVLVIITVMAPIGDSWNKVKNTIFRL